MKRAVAGMACGLALALAPSAPALAHGGGVNAEGCHTNRKTGEYHCHRPRAATGTRAPAVSTSRPLSSGASSGRFSSCAAARAAGAAPLRRGDAGYSTRLDRDGDGVACE